MTKHMPRTPLPPIAATVSFLDCINRGDLDGLAALMTDDHTLIVLDEPPLVGRQANRDAWYGQFTAFPNYVIHRARSPRPAGQSPFSAPPPDRIWRCRTNRR